MAGKAGIFLVVSTLLIFASSVVNAQEFGARRDGDPLIPTCRFEGALCGYVNPAGETIIAPKYDWADRFNGGRAKVRYGGLFGFIDEAGREVVPLIYDNVSEYWHGFAQVRKDGRTALIDSAGETVVPAEWDHIIPLDDSRHLVGLQFQPKRRVGLGFQSGPWARWQFFDRLASTLAELPGQRI